jgi:hypothetical protein
MGLHIIVPPDAEPVSIEEAAAHCRVVSQADYARLLAMVSAAREWCESYLGQQLVTATYRWTIDRFINLYIYQSSLWTQQVWPWIWNQTNLIGNRLPNAWYTLWVPRSPVKSIVQIKYYDLDGNLQTLDPSTYLLDNNGLQARITPAFGLYWPPTQMRMDAAQIDLVCGYDTVPEAARLAICMLAAAWFDQREAVSFDNPTEVPMGVKSLLDSMAVGRYVLL